MSIETIAAIGFSVVMLLAVVGVLIVKGLSYDPDAWMDRQVAYWRANRGDEQ